MTIEQANQYFAALPEGFAPAEELRAALPAAAQQVAYVGVAGTAGKTAAAA
jgi:dihydrofolate synthase/folylpolyglutamate synthase